MSATAPASLLNCDQAAEVLGVSSRQVRELWRRRELAAIKVGALVRFSSEDLRAYIARQRVDAVSTYSPPR